LPVTRCGGTVGLHKLLVAPGFEGVNVIAKNLVRWMGEGVHSLW